MGDFVCVCSGHSANRPDAIQLQNKHNFCTTESCLFRLNTTTTIAVWLLVHTGWYLAGLKPKCLKHTPQTTEDGPQLPNCQKRRCQHPALLAHCGLSSGTISFNTRSCSVRVTSGILVYDRVVNSRQQRPQGKFLAPHHYGCTSDLLYVLQQIYQ